MKVFEVRHGVGSGAGSPPDPSRQEAMRAALVQYQRVRRLLGLLYGGEPPGPGGSDRGRR